MHSCLIMSSAHVIALGIVQVSGLAPIPWFNWWWPIRFCSADLSTRTSPPPCTRLRSPTVACPVCSTLSSLAQQKFNTFTNFCKLKLVPRPHYIARDSHPSGSTAPLTTSTICWHVSFLESRPDQNLTKFFLCQRDCPLVDNKQTA